MKRRVFRLLLAFTLASTFTSCTTSSHSSSCEYKVITEYADKGKLEKQINEISRLGWHLVSVSAGGGDVSHVPLVILIYARTK